MLQRKNKRAVKKKRYSRRYALVLWIETYILPCVQVRQPVMILHMIVQAHEAEDIC